MRHFLVYSKTGFQLSLVSIIFCICSIKATVYPYGSNNGDTAIEWIPTNVELDIEIPFLGGTLSNIWISTLGAISQNNIKQPILNNIILSPLFSELQQGQSGMIYYSQATDDTDLFGSIAADVTFSDLDEEYLPTYALIVTWHEVASPDDSSKLNTFQIVLSSDTRKTLVSFNYDSLTWTSSKGVFAPAGILIFGDSTQTCQQLLPGSGTSLLSQLTMISTSSESIGKHVFDITGPLLCSSKFEVPCGNLPSKGRGSLKSFFELRNNSALVENFFLLFECKPGLHLSPGKTTQKIQCLYDSDYYDYVWEANISLCIDLNATRRFVTTIDITKINDDKIIWTNNEQQFNELKETITPALEKLFESLGITDALYYITNVVNQTRDTNETVVVVEFMTFLPPYVNQRLKNITMQGMIDGTMLENNEFKLVTFRKNQTVTVTDTTSSCLQKCLCRNRRDPILCRRGTAKIIPDACCGECSGPMKAYASSVKVCCNNRVLYDPTRSVCCDGIVKRGDRC